MPIRFRCVYCDKLLGIARRKAGSVVSCPHCSEKLIVPTPEEEPGSNGADIAPNDEPIRNEVPAPPMNQLFERSDFEALLSPGPAFRNESEEHPETPAERPKKKPHRLPSIPEDPPRNRAAPHHSLDPIPLDDAPQLSRPVEGIVVSRSRMTWISVILVLALAGTFALGVVVGKMLK